MPVLSLELQFSRGLSLCLALPCLALPCLAWLSLPVPEFQYQRQSDAADEAGEIADGRNPRFDPALSLCTAQYSLSKVPGSTAL